jgi:hypothetical protein
VTVSTLRGLSDVDIIAVTLITLAGRIKMLMHIRERIGGLSDRAHIQIGDETHDQ